MSALQATLKSPWIKRPVEGLRYLLKYWPWFVFSMLIGHLTKENFPFSHWPMYGDFAQNVDYVFFEDQKGNAIPAFLFRETSARLKRQFNSERKREYAELRKTDKTRAMREVFEQRSVETAAVRITERVAQRLTKSLQTEYGNMRMVRVVLSYGENHEIRRDRFEGAYVDLSDMPHAPEGSLPSPPPPPGADGGNEEEEEGKE